MLILISCSWSAAPPFPSIIIDGASMLLGYVLVIGLPVAPVN